MCPKIYRGKMSDEKDERREVSGMSSSEEMEDYSSISSDNDYWEKGNSGYTCESRKQVCKKILKYFFRL